MPVNGLAPIKAAKENASLLATISIGGVWQGWGKDSQGRWLHFVADKKLPEQGWRVDRVEQDAVYLLNLSEPATEATYPPVYLKLELRPQEE